MTNKTRCPNCKSTNHAEILWGLPADMEKLQKEWIFSDDTHGVGKILLDVDKTIIANLESVRKELVPKCSHPKKMQDVDSKGNRYCMDCNMDL